MWIVASIQSIKVTVYKLRIHSSDEYMWLVYYKCSSTPSFSWTVKIAMLFIDEDNLLCPKRLIIFQRPGINKMYKIGTYSQVTCNSKVGQGEGQRREFPREKMSLPLEDGGSLTWMLYHSWFLLRNKPGGDGVGDGWCWEIKSKYEEQLFEIWWHFYNY